MLGDCHGASCAPQIVEAARDFLAERGFAVALNAPYAGGFTTGHYGHPRRGRHALQIEINRALYMDERSYRRGAGFDRLRDEMAGLIGCLGGGRCARLSDARACLEDEKPRRRQKNGPCWCTARVQGGNA